MHTARRVASASLAILAIAAAGAGTASAAPGLPRTYDHRVIDSPNPIGGGSFGWGVASADVTGDGEADLLVAQAQTGPGQIFIFDGVSGGHVDTIDPPEENPDAQPETLAFVYVETMPDIGSCPGGDGADDDRICDLPSIAGGDGIPEIVAGSRNLRVDSTDGSSPPDAADPRIGRAYVFDGATRAVLKRIDMPQSERAALPANAAPQFGRLVMSPQGLEPCAGSSAENNAVGVSQCPPKTTDDACAVPTPPQPANAVGRCIRIGDVNGLGQPDLVVTARNFAGTSAGKAWVYAGEAIAGSDPRAILQTAIYGVNNPVAQAGEFGGNVFRVGDVTADGRPDFVIAARTLDYPLNAPDSTAFSNVGAAFLVDGATGAVARTLVHPDPKPRDQFSASFNSGRPTGDLGATGTPDILLPAPLHNATSTDDGRAWVFNGDSTAGGGAEQSWQFATLTDPTPVTGGNFGGAQTGVGDLVDGTGAPANEVLIAGFRFDTFTAPSRDAVADLHIMNPETERNLQTIPHPENVPGDGFGMGLAPMGDLNDDGFLDIAASSYLANVGAVGGAGRAYILTSDDSPLPAEPTPQPTPAASPTPSPAPVSTPAPLKPGACVNDVTGTAASENVFGTLAGDTIFGLAGNDFINGFQGEDCIDGGSGADRIDGGSDSDQLVGRSGRDRLKGRDGRDRLYGSGGRDNLVGDYGRDMLAGGRGNDVLDGGPDADRLFGEGGRDRIEAGDGRNEVDGGRGGDVIDTRNDERDTILCGPGRDRARVDRFDSVNGCERVSRSRR